MANINNANLILKDAAGNVATIRTLTDADVAKLKASMTQTEDNRSAIASLDERVSKVVGTDGAQVEATTEKLGVVKLASDADVENAVVGKVVDAKQLASVKSTLAKVYKYKGTVATFTDLPSADVQNGDIYNVEAAYNNYPAGTNFAAIVDTDGSVTWDGLGGSIDTSDYAMKSADNVFTGVNTVIDPTSATQIANKGYVDSVVKSGIDGILQYSATAPTTSTLEVNTATFYPAENLL